LTWLRGRLLCCRPCEPEPGNTGGGKKLNTNQSQKPKANFSNTRILSEIAIFVALATALSFLIIFQFPEGGAITLGSMVPILWLALRRGPKIGLIAGAIYGIVQLAIMPQIYYLPQVLLDYPFAFGCLGLAGFFQKRWALVGVTLAITGRFIMHLISGVMFFASFAPPGMNPWGYSALYNGSYLLPELAISLFVIFMLQKSKALKMFM
jgi:thiamine transporter